MKDVETIRRDLGCYLFALFLYPGNFFIRFDIFCGFTLCLNSVFFV